MNESRLASREPITASYKPIITAVYSCVVIDTQKLIGMEFILSSSFLVMFNMTSLLWLVVN